MKKFLRIFFGIAVITNLSGCLYGQCMDGPCAFERAKMIENIKPYGAHWIKEGMTRESRSADWLQCGGASGLNDGYERKSGLTTNEYFDGLDFHRKRIRSCMDDKGYLWIEQCDARCL
jgi:hypothetical protein